MKTIISIIIAFIPFIIAHYNLGGEYLRIFHDLYLYTLIAFLISALLGAIKDISVHKPIKFFLYHKFNDKWKEWFFSTYGKGKYIKGKFVLGRKKFIILGRQFTVPVQLTDAFHFFKMLQIITYISIPSYILSYIMEYQLICFIGIWLCLGIFRNSIFSLGYEKLFINLK